MKIMYRKLFNIYIRTLLSSTRKLSCRANSLEPSFPAQNHDSASSREPQAIWVSERPGHVTALRLRVSASADSDSDCGLDQSTPWPLGF